MYDIIRKIVAALAPGDALLEQARAVLDNTGIVRGEFGFVEVYEERKALLQSWLDEPNESVRQFAIGQIHRLEQRIAMETRAAQASIALRRLPYGEEPGVNSNT